MTRDMAKELKSGKMGISTKGSGNQIREMEKVFSFGRTEVNTKEIGKTIKKKELEFTPVPMATYSLALGTWIK